MPLKTSTVCPEIYVRPSTRIFFFRRVTVLRNDRNGSEQGAVQLVRNIIMPAHGATESARRVPGAAIKITVNVI